MPQIKPQYSAPFVRTTGLQEQYSETEGGPYDKPLSFPPTIAQYANGRFLAERHGDFTPDLPTASNPNPATIKDILAQQDGTKATVMGPIRDAMLLRPSARMWERLAARTEEQRIEDAAWTSKLISEQTGKPVHLNPANPTAGLLIWNDHELHVVAADRSRKEETVVIWGWRGNAGVDALVGAPLASGFAQNDPSSGRQVIPDQDMRTTLRRKANIEVGKIDYLGFDNTSNSWGTFPVVDTDGKFHVGLLPAVQAVGSGVTGPLSQVRKQIETTSDMGVLVTTLNDLERLAAGRVVAVKCYPSISPKTQKMVELATQIAGGASELPFEAVLEASRHPDAIVDGKPYALMDKSILILMTRDQFQAVGHDFLPGALIALKQNGAKPSIGAEHYVARNSTIGPISEELGRAWGRGPQSAVPA